MGSSGEALCITFPVTICLGRVLDRVCNWGTCVSKSLEPSAESKHNLCRIDRSWTKVVALSSLLHSLLVADHDGKYQYHGRGLSQAFVLHDRIFL